jgi:hypothetical protein
MGSSSQVPEKGDSIMIFVELKNDQYGTHWSKAKQIEYNLYQYKLSYFSQIKRILYQDIWIGENGWQPLMSKSPEGRQGLWRQ